MGNRKAIGVIRSLYPALLLTLVLIINLFFLTGCGDNTYTFDVHVVDRIALNQGQPYIIYDISGNAPPMGSPGPRWAGEYTGMPFSLLDYDSIDPYLIIHARSKGDLSLPTQEHRIIVTSTSTNTQGQTQPNIFWASVYSAMHDDAREAGFDNNLCTCSFPNPIPFLPPIVIECMYTNCAIPHQGTCTTNIATPILNHITANGLAHCDMTAAYFDAAFIGNTRAESFAAFRLRAPQYCDKRRHTITVDLGGLPEIVTPPTPESERGIQFVLDTNWDVPEGQYWCLAPGCAGYDPAKPPTWGGDPARGGECCGKDPDDDPDMSDIACSFCFRGDNQPTGSQQSGGQPKRQYSPFSGAGVGNTVAGLCCGDDESTWSQSDPRDCANMATDRSHICGNPNGWGWQATSPGTIHSFACLANQAGNPSRMVIPPSGNLPLYCGTGATYTLADDYATLPIPMIGAGQENRQFRRFGGDSETPNPLMINELGYLCLRNDAIPTESGISVNVCHGSGSGDITGANDYTTGQPAIAKDGNSILYFYCKSDNTFSTNLDTSDAATCEAAQKPTSTGFANAGLKWTGTQCCGEQEDGRNIGYESYLDIQRACFKDTGQENNDFLRFDHDNDGTPNVFYEVYATSSGSPDNFVHLYGCAIDAYNNNTGANDGSGVEQNPRWRSTDTRGGKPYEGLKDPDGVPVPGHPSTNDFLLIGSSTFGVPSGFPINPDIHGGRNTNPYINNDNYIIEDKAYCTVIEGGASAGYKYCSYREVWKNAPTGITSTDQLHLSYMEWSPGDTFQHAECCKINECWDGESGATGACVSAASYDNPRTPPKGDSIYAGYRCQMVSGHAEWIYRTEKLTPLNKNRGWCPRDDQCLMSPNPNIDAPNSPAVPLSCVDAGTYWGDYYCDLNNPTGWAEWVSRHRDLGLALLSTIDITQAGGLYSQDYTLFCGSYEHALNRYNYKVNNIFVTSDNPAEFTYFNPAYPFDGTLTPIGGLKAVEKTCVLRRGSDSTIYLGIALNRPPNFLGGPGTQDNAGILRLFDLYPQNPPWNNEACDHILGQNVDEYKKCDYRGVPAKGVWYNPKRNALIFALNPQESVWQKTQPSVLQSLITWFRNLVAQMVNKIILFIQGQGSYEGWEEDKSFLKKGVGGDAFYIARKGNLKMYATLERRYENLTIGGLREFQYITMNLSGFPTSMENICTTITSLPNIEDSTYCSRDLVNGDYVIVSRDEILSTQHGLSSLWSTLTASVRLDDS